MRLALAQINTVVGDLDGNRERIVRRLAEARDEGADLILFPELAVTGYPPEGPAPAAGVGAAAERPWSRSPPSRATLSRSSAPRTTTGAC